MAARTPVARTLAELAELAERDAGAGRGLRLGLAGHPRGANARGGGAFIETHIAPDMTTRPVGQTVDLLEGAGLEVRDVEAPREHDVWTVRAWWQALERRWDDVVALIGGTSRTRADLLASRVGA